MPYRLKTKAFVICADTITKCVEAWFKAKPTFPQYEDVLIESIVEFEREPEYPNPDDTALNPEYLASSMDPALRHALQNGSWENPEFKSGEVNEIIDWLESLSNQDLINVNSLIDMPEALDKLPESELKSKVQKLIKLRDYNG